MSEASQLSIVGRVGRSSEIAQFIAPRWWRYFASWAFGHRSRLHLCFILLGVALAGCGSLSSSPSAQREPTELELFIEASDRLNPDPQGRAAPILLRIYELRSADVFQEADFFALYLRDRSTLGGEILMVDQFILRPGQVQVLQRRSNPESRYIGVVAGYRDLPISTWRALYRMPTTPELKWYSALTPGSTSSLRIDLQPNSVLITDLTRTSNLVTTAHRSDGIGPDVLEIGQERNPDISLIDQPLSPKPGAMTDLDPSSAVKVPMPETPGPFHQQPSLLQPEGDLRKLLPPKPVVAQ